MSHPTGSIEIEYTAEFNTLLEKEKIEPLLTAEVPYALTIKDEKLFELYENHFSLFWSHREIDTDRDKGHWERLTSHEQHYISKVLAFFATSDGIVFENIKMNFENEVKLQEARFFYGFQAMIENVHAQTYINVLRAYVTDEQSQRKLIDSIKTDNTIKQKAEWALKHFDRETIPFAVRLLAFACVEGIFFSGAFCSIFWLKQHRHGLLDALTFSNQLISRDEGLHTEFAVEIFKRLQNKPSEEIVHSVVKSAVELEEEFICDALEVALIGMNSDSMRQYIKFVADRLLAQLQYGPLYRVSNPYAWMEQQSMRVTTNFFESKVAEYALAPQGNVSLDADF